MLGEVLTHQQLLRLKEHKYSSCGSSLLEVFFQPFWKWLVTKIPLWMAPNLITFVGLVINVFATLLLIYFDPTGKGYAPQWCYLLFGVALFIYQQLDAIDGKQARRTNTATPLGEMFDHGCDAVSIVCCAEGTLMAAGLGNYRLIFFSWVLIGSVLYYCGHWQSYVCGNMTFRMLDVTEAQVFIVVIHLISFSLGVQFWSWHLFGIELRLYVIIVMFLICGTTIILDLVAIFTGGKGKAGSTIADSSILAPSVPLAIILFLSWTYMKHSEEFYLNWTAIVMFVLALPLVKLSWMIVVAHMTRSPLSMVDWIMIGPLALLVNNHFGKILNDGVAFFIVSIFIVIDLLVYACKVCRQVSTFFNISCFTIPYSTEKDSK